MSSCTLNICPCSRAHDAGQIKSTSIAIAIIAFFFLDFALNGLQASLRNLLLDVTPAEQLNQANAWHGRMNHAGSIIGNGVGMRSFVLCV